MTDQWCTYTDAATLTGVPEATIRTWGKRGRVATRKIGGRIHVSLAEARRAERDLRLYGPKPGRRRVGI